MNAIRAECAAYNDGRDSFEIEPNAPNPYRRINARLHAAWRAGWIDARRAAHFAQALDDTSPAQMALEML